MKTWIVVANRSEAKIFYSDPKRGQEVEYVSKLENPRGRLRNGDINADKPGAFGVVGSHGSTRMGPQSPTERVAQDFALEIIEALKVGKTLNQYEDLILIADPHFLGLLRNHMPKELSRMISREEAKDLNLSTSEDLQERLWPQDNSLNI